MRSEEEYRDIAEEYRVMAGLMPLARDQWLRMAEEAELMAKSARMMRECRVAMSAPKVRVMVVS